MTKQRERARQLARAVGRSPKAEREELGRFAKLLKGVQLSQTQRTMARVEVEGCPAGRVALAGSACQLGRDGLRRIGPPRRHR